MSGGGGQSTITSAPYALPLPSDEGAGGTSMKEEVLANGTVITPAAAAAAAAGLKRKLDPAEEAKIKEMEYKKRLAQAAATDRARALQPDYTTPFTHSAEIIQRLLCYHVFNAPHGDPKAEEEEWKKEYAAKATDLLARVDRLKTQYEKHVPKTATQSKEERILLNKLSYFDEKFEVESLKTRLGLRPPQPPPGTPQVRLPPPGTPAATASPMTRPSLPSTPATPLPGTPAAAYVRPPAPSPVPLPVSVAPAPLPVSVVAPPPLPAALPQVIHVDLPVSQAPPPPVVAPAPSASVSHSADGAPQIVLGQ